LGGFDFNDRWGRRNLLKASLASRRKRAEVGWRGMVGQVLRARVLEPAGVQPRAVLRVYAPAASPPSAHTAGGSALPPAKALREDEDAIAGETLAEGDELFVLVKNALNHRYAPHRRAGYAEAAGSFGEREFEDGACVRVSRSDASLVAELARREVLALKEGEAEIFGIARVAGAACKIGIEVLADGGGGGEAGGLRPQIVQSLGRLGRAHFGGEEISPVFKGDRETMVAEALSWKHREEITVRFTNDHGRSAACEVECPEHLEADLVGPGGMNTRLATSLLMTDISVVRRGAASAHEAERGRGPDADEFPLPFDGMADEEDGLGLLAYDEDFDGDDLFPSPLAPWAPPTAAGTTIDEEFDDLVGILKSGAPVDDDPAEGAGDGEVEGCTAPAPPPGAAATAEAGGGGMDAELSEFVQGVFDRQGADLDLRGADGAVDYLDMARNMTRGDEDRGAPGGEGADVRALTSMIDDV
ncbi:MAG: hypothetical protein VX463_19825, partial [Pseudomonadota bacterium]|nr:hypothetical protein [Pseudomonadota bacterium]